MTTSIRAELPEKLVEEARKFVEAGWAADFIPVTDDFLRRESDQREDGLRRAAFQPEKKIQPPEI